MYKFHYNVLLPEYPNANLCFTDTDSFLYEIKTQDIYKDLHKLKEYFDFSNYPPEHPLYSTENKTKIGLMKDECGSKSISEFVGLRSKMYSLTTVDGVQKARAAGVKKHVKNKILKHNLYKRAVFGIPFKYTLNNIEYNHPDFAVIQNSFRTYNHQVKTISQRRTGVSAYDDKRWGDDCGLTTKAHGHYKNR